MKQNLVLEGLSSLYTTIRQYIVDQIFDYVVRVNKRKTIMKCIQYNAKFYMIQASNFRFQVLRKSELGAGKSRITFKELQEKAVFVAYPHIHNLKNYTENGYLRKKSN